ncbi:MAG: inositol-3-phosphate synthase [Candidatus Cloacimonadales bacterium]|nr:inositol-3-phosphate synthase [Candidatus Cloacimonadales bacterium]
MQIKIKQTPAKLGVLIPGMGAIGTTFIAGIELIKKGYSKPIGSMTQMGTIRLGKRTEHRNPLIKDFLPIAKIEDLVFGCWDIFEDTAYDSAKNAQVLSNEHIELVKDELMAIKPMKAVFDNKYVKKLDGPNVKKAATKYDLALMLMDDIENFKKANNLTNVVMVWCASTEIYIELQDVHKSVEAFEKAMKENHEAIAPSMLYAYAAMKKGIPFANGAPNLTVDIPAIWTLAKENQVPIAGKDYKTGQTLMKTIIAPGLKARLLGINGWFSTNILGNRDGEVLDDPESFKTKEVSKLGVLDYILQPDQNPDLYKDLYHKVRINYYPPRGDNKEGWDNIDIFGWLGYKMQIKIDFLCKDSILAAPIVLDLVLLMDLAKRVGFHGIQEWLSFYFKSPMHLPELYPEHDLFVQLAKFKNTLRYIMKEDMITHLGLDYYEDQMRDEDQH